MMYHLKEVIDVKQAAEILGCSPSNISLLIRKGKITTAFKGSGDGHIGQPGWRMYRDEIESIKLPGRGNRKPREKKVDEPKSEPKKDSKNVKKLLGDLKTCLELLIETIGELEKEL
jgi:hypothetical protein